MLPIPNMPFMPVAAADGLDVRCEFKDAPHAAPPALLPSTTCAAPWPLILRSLSAFFASAFAKRLRRDKSAALCSAAVCSTVFAASFFSRSVRAKDDRRLAFGSGMGRLWFESV